MNSIPANITDIHTHRIANRANALVSGSPAQVRDWLSVFPEGHYCVGIHPWSTTNLSPSDEAEQLRELEAVAASPSVTAIGETGLDALRGGDTGTQERIFRAHISLSEKLGKPLVLHVVKSFNRITEIRKELAATLQQPWIFHGFRGKPELARQLLACSTENSPVFISLGEHFNRATAREIPRGRLLCETDESLLPIEEITARIEAARADACQGQ